MIFKFSEDTEIDSSEDPWSRTGVRVGIYGDPGSTKSYTAAAAFVEPFLDQGGSVVIFQPRAEWHTLKTVYPDIQVVGGPHNQDLPFTASHPKLYSDAVANDGISFIFYTGDAPSIDQLIGFVSKFLDYLMKALEKKKRPIMIVLEEANRYAPLSPKNHPEGAAPWVLGPMIGRILEMYRDARKLGIVPLMITQRPQDLNYPARQLCNLTLLGSFSSQDIKYVDKELLAPMRKDLDVDLHPSNLVALNPGEWIIVQRKTAVHAKLTVKRKTPHGADTPELTYVPEASLQTAAKVGNLGAKLRELLEKEAAQESELEKTKAKAKRLENELAEKDEKIKTFANLRDILTQGNGDPKKIEEAYERGLQEGQASRQVDAEQVQRLEHERDVEKNRADKLLGELDTYSALGTLLRQIANIDPKQIEQNILDKVLQRLPAELPTAVSTELPAVDVSQASLEVRVKRENVTAGEKDLKGQIGLLIHDGGFDKYRRISGIADELRALGNKVESKALSETLQWFAQQRILRNIEGHGWMIVDRKRVVVKEA